jgi:glycosyltransferase involved in cell wall biosynthesis
MRIGIIATGLKHDITGMGRYSYKLITNLLKMDKKNDYTLIDFKPDIEASQEDVELFSRCSKLSFHPLRDIVLSLKLLVEGSGVSMSDVPMFFWLIRKHMMYSNVLECYYGLRNHLIRPSRLSTENLDVLHGPANFTPLLSFGNYKKVITVHDIIAILFPEFYSKRFSRAHSRIFPKQLSFVDRIIVDSQSTRNDLIEHLRVPSEKIITIPLSVDEQFRPLKHRDDIKKHQINSNYILFVGCVRPHKNITTLIQAFYKLKKRGIKHILVIAGEKYPHYNEVDITIEKLGLRKEVILTGHFPERNLPILYNAADLFVFPSLYEGFGLPPLEAMACGCPVITSNTSSLPEVVGDAGIMINPNNVDALADAMYRVLTNKGLRQDMIKKGLKRAKMFSWEKTAKETLRVYEEVYDE